MTKIGLEAYTKVTKELFDMMSELTEDLFKAERGNQAAAQRFRVKSIKFEKKAKLYRKLSIWKQKQQ